MLTAFSSAYRHPNPGGRGPRTDAASAEEKKKVTLKTGGDPDAYTDGWNEYFAWYPYLFLSHSKPERHLSAIGRIDPKMLASDAPPELKALVEHVKNALGLVDPAP
jgi:hypothetical protein